MLQTGKSIWSIVRHVDIADERSTYARDTSWSMSARPDLITIDTQQPQQPRRRSGLE